MENENSPKQVKRGFVPTDSRDFGEKSLEKLRKSAEEVYFLVSRGYAVKNATVFAGNHHMLSERQRLAVARAVSPKSSIMSRKQKELSDGDIKGETVFIDGFNLIITLETAFSGSPLFHCMDGTIRDLAGLRGSYRLIDKTYTAISAVAETLTALGIKKAVFYLDSPVSNSGRLGYKISELMNNCPFETEIFIEGAVDSILEKKSHVVTSDAIILDRCISWFNLTERVIKRHIGDYGYIDIINLKNGALQMP
ncbi:MAG: DUF434 domain-containing protein [Ruminococcus sp.]|nr:DUF434 domain-containing protein [Ruminococcus sp.]